ncbi:MAG: chorismate mutase [Candidatus Woesearchaeota archaeon]
MNHNEQIKPLRKKIAEIDDAIITLIEARLEIVNKIWKIKKENKIELRDKKKERELIEKLKEKSRLNPQIIEILYQQIFEENQRIYG